MIDLIVGIVGLFALIGIIVILARKFPTLASIDTTVIPEERHGELKAKLIEDRLKRRLDGIGVKVRRSLVPTGKLISAFVRARYRQLLELERQYRARSAQHAPATPEQHEQLVQQIDVLISTAQDALRTGDINCAETKAIEIISRNPRSVEAYKILVKVYLERKDYEHARETLQFIIDRLHVSDDAIFAEMSQIATGEGNLQEAKQDLEQSIALNGRVAQYHLDLCQVHLALGESTNAFEECRKASEMEPNNPKFLDALTETSIVAGKREWAEESLEKLRAVNPENGKIDEFASRIGNMPKIRRQRNG